MHKNLLAIGISFLFLGVVVSPMTLGYDVETSQEQPDTEGYLYPENYHCYNVDEIDGYVEYQDTEVFNDNKPVESTKPLDASPPMDSPWPMYCHDVRHTGRSPYSTEDNPLTEKWRYFCEGWIEETPSIDNNNILYIQGYNKWGGKPFYYKAINPNGTVKWIKNIGMIDGSSPAIAEDGTIYVGTWEDKLFALNPNGTRKWKFNSDGASIFSSPAIAEDGTIYFGTLWSLGAGGKIFAVNPDGTLKWKYKTQNHISSSPAIGFDGTVYIGSYDYNLYAMHPNGTLRWRFKTNDHIGGSPSIADDGTIYFGSYDDYLYALNPNGELKWKYNTGYGCAGAPAIAKDGTIYVGTDNVYALNPDGTLKWIFDLGDDCYIGFSSPAISSDGTIFIGVTIDNYNGGYLLAINSDGTERWRKRLCEKVWIDSSPSIGEDGTVYICSANDIEFQNPGWWTGVGCLHAFGKVDSNIPPTEPTIKGSSSGKVGKTYILECRAKDPDINPIDFHIDWGDGTIQDFGPYASGEPRFIRHKWKLSGNLTLKVKAKDRFGGESNWTTLNVTVDKVPYAPDIDGPILGKSGIDYEFTFVSTHPDNWTIKYEIDWDDGDSMKTDYYESGEMITLNHSWDTRGKYIIEARTIDENGGESNWSQHVIFIPRNRATSNLWYHWFLERFPLLEKLLSLVKKKLIGSII